MGVCLKPGRVTNTFIAATPEHPILERALRELTPLDEYFPLSDRESIKEAAGPAFLRRLLEDHPDVKLLEPPLVFPSTQEERERAVAVHHMARSWHNVSALRAAIQQAERRLELTTVKLAQEERRHAATKKRLERLEDRLEGQRAGKRGIWERLGLLRR